MTEASPREPARRLASALVLGQLALHLVYGVRGLDPRLAGPHLVGLVQDVVLIALVAGAAILGERRLPGRARALARVAGLGLLLALGFVLATYPRMLAEFLVFPQSLFEADLGTAVVFARDYVGPGGFVPLLGTAVLAGCALATPRFPAIRTRLWFAIPLGLVAFLTALAPAPQPLLYSVQDLVTSHLGGPGRAVPRLRRPDAARVSLGRLPVPLEGKGDLSCDHVLFLVLESVVSESFERELLSRKDGFFARVKDRARYYAGWHCTNLDSYTGLIAFLTGVRVPYRAYSSPEAYERVNEVPNVVRSLRARGHEALFVSTYEHQPFVPVRADWDRVLDRRDLGSLEGFVSLGSSRMESATEDRAALPEILSFVKKAKRTVVLHELVFGHSPEWRARTGIDPLDSYDRYLRELLDGLEKAGLDRRTLLVVVSDHGERARVSDPDNYRVPLLLVGPGVAPGVDRAFRSHLDLPAVLGHHLRGDPLPAPAGGVLTVGSTERWVYGEVTARGDAAFVDESRGRVLGSRGNPDLVDLRERFQADLDRFAAILAGGGR